MKRGAFDYLSKPANLDELLFTLRRAREIKELKDENLRLRSQIQEQHRFDKIIGRSQAIAVLYGIIAGSPNSLDRTHYGGKDRRN